MTSRDQNIFNFLKSLMGERVMEETILEQKDHREKRARELGRLDLDDMGSKNKLTSSMVQ
jgi:hypothetical protein